MKSEAWNPLLKSYPDSDKINAVSMGAETLYTRLIAQSDDASHYYGETRWIAFKLFTARNIAGQVTEEMIAGWVKELESVGLIELYVVDGHTFIELIGVKKCLRSDVKKEVRFPKKISGVTNQQRTRNEHVTNPARARNERGPLDPEPEETQNHTPAATAPEAEAPKVEQPKQELKLREPNPLWDAVAKIWFGGKVDPPHRSRVGKLARDFKDLHATPEEIHTRLERHKKIWPKAEASPESLVKNWVRFGPPANIDMFSGQREENLSPIQRAMNSVNEMTTPRGKLGRIETILGQTKDDSVRQVMLAEKEKLAVMA